MRVELARRALDGAVADVRARLVGLQRYRAVRIGIAAFNATKLPVQAALATLGPLRRMATRGVIVALRVTHAGIATGVAKARALLGGLTGFGRSVVSALTSGFGLIGIAMAGLGGFGFGSLIKSSMDAIDVNAKLADRLGLTTEAISGLQYAGDLAGVSAEQLTGGLEKDAEQHHDAATKGGPAADAFNTLGLNVKKLSESTADEAFSQIADGLTKVENPAQRASLAMDIFGKAGQGLLR